MRVVIDIFAEAFVGVLKDSIQHRIDNVKYEARVIRKGIKGGIWWLLCCREPKLDRVPSYDLSFDSLSTGYDSPADTEDLPPARRPSLVHFSTQGFDAGSSDDSLASQSSANNDHAAHSIPQLDGCPYDAMIRPNPYRSYDLSSATSSSTDLSFYSCYSTQLAAQEAVLEYLKHLFEEADPPPPPLRGILKKTSRESAWKQAEVTSSHEDTAGHASCCILLQCILLRSSHSKTTAEPITSASGLRSLYLHDNIAIDGESIIDEDDHVSLTAKFKLMVKSAINDIAWSTPVHRLRTSISTRLDDRAGKWPVKNRRPRPEGWQVSPW